MHCKRPIESEAENTMEIVLSSTYTTGVLTIIDNELQGGVTKVLLKVATGIPPNVIEALGVDSEGPNS